MGVSLTNKATGKKYTSSSGTRVTVSPAVEQEQTPKTSYSSPSGSVKLTVTEKNVNYVADDEYFHVAHILVKFSDEQQARYENLNLRLADEYMALKNEMPDAPEYSDLPDSVIIEAAKGNRDLFSAYLCYLYKERKKVEAAQKTQVAASMASSGKMAVDKGNEMTSSDRNFLLGLWSK